MPTYFARKAGNINATDVWATAPGGTASAVTFASGDVLVSNSFAIAINVSTDLGGSGQLRNDTLGGATAGGTFTLAAGLTLTANILQNNTTGGATVVTCTFNAPLSASIVGNVTSPVNTSGNNRPVSLTGNGTLNFTGNATGDMKFSSTGGAIGNAGGGTINFVGTATGGGGTTGYALENASSGTINITGNCLGATGAAVQNAAGGTINITGNATGGSASGGSGVNNAAGGVIAITGNATGGSASGGSGVNNAAGGVIAITGNATGGVSGPGVTNASSGSVTATRAVGNGFGLGSVGLTATPGIANSGNAGVVEVRELEYGLRGMSPVTGFVRLKRASLNQTIFNWVDTGSAKILVDATQGEMPAVGNVRLGVSYASGALVGACAVPSPATVATGVPIDATVGTAALSVGDVAAAVWGAASRTITGGTVDTLTNPPTVPTVVQIRQEMDSNSTKLSNLDATISSRLADADYTAPTSAPSASTVATAVRTELGTELGRIDQNISSRLADADYTTPPTTAQIATAVESSILNEADGQAVLNAIVGAIGNTNLSEVSLVAAVRADLERNGGKLDSIPTDAAPSAASVATAVWSASTKEITGGTVTTLTNSPDVPTEAEIASQVRTELSVELGRIDAAISSRLAPSGTLATVTTLTNAPTVPTAAAIADEVRVELATELARIDAPVSGATAPSAATVATAVRSELATELARVDQAVSSRLAGSAYTAPANSDITAIKAKTDLLETTRLAQCSTVATTGAQLAAALS